MFEMQSNLRTNQFQTTSDPDVVDRFIDVFTDRKPETYIRDLQADVGAISIAEQLLPYTVSDPISGTNCYLCSPSTTFIDYALDETRNLEQSPWIKCVSSAMIKACTPLVRASGMDRQIQINNWLISTNPVPEFSLEVARTIRDEVVAQFPDRAIVIRSLNEITDHNTIRTLKAAGFKMLATRQIYILPRSQRKQFRDAKRDAAVLRNTPFELVDGENFLSTDFDRCEQLYNALYLEKYTVLNPHYTADFFREMYHRGIMRFVGLRDGSNGLVGFTGLFHNLSILVQPFLGYDTSRPVEQGLYRMLMAIGRDYASQHNLVFNMSAGASGFKRNRGAIPAIEYTAVYVDHLSLRNKIATGIISKALQYFGVPLIRKFEL